jgi:hypothetical protein
MRGSKLWVRQSKRACPGFGFPELVLGLIEDFFNVPTGYVEHGNDYSVRELGDVGVDEVVAIIFFKLTAF